MATDKDLESIQYPDDIDLYPLTIGGIDYRELAFRTDIGTTLVAQNNIYGYDPTAGTWKKVEVDDQGRIELGADIDIGNLNLLNQADSVINPATEGTLSGLLQTSDKQQITDSTTSTATWISLDLGDVRNGVDVAVDISGSATLTIQVSTTGDFAGEEFEVQTIDYSSAVVSLEQFEFRHQHVRCKVDANLNNLEMIARGD